MSFLCFSVPMFKLSLEPSRTEAGHLQANKRSGLPCCVSWRARRFCLQTDANMRQINCWRRGDTAQSVRLAVTSSVSASAPPQRPYRPRSPRSTGGTRLSGERGRSPPSAAPTPPGSRADPWRKTPGPGAEPGPGAAGGAGRGRSLAREASSRGGRWRRRGPGGRSGQGPALQGRGARPAGCLRPPQRGERRRAAGRGVGALFPGRAGGGQGLSASPRPANAAAVCRLI